MPADAVLRHFDLQRYFTSIVGGDTVPERKSHPQHLLATFERMVATPDHNLDGAFFCFRSAARFITEKCEGIVNTASMSGSIANRP